MKKKILLIISLILIFASISCTTDVVTSSQTIDETIYDGSYSINEKTSYTGYLGVDLETTFTYKDEYFKESSFIENKSLADVSLIKSMASTCTYLPDSNYYDDIVNFHKKCQFSNFFISKSYTELPTNDSIAYIFASKNVKYNDKTYLLISIAVRGFRYGAEWASNFKIGASGNHQGFDEASNMILNDFKDYLNKYNSLNNEIKIWISGYSRAGSVSDLLGVKIADLNLVNEENMYVYTFEASASTLKSDKEYNFIYNYINPSDFVIYIIPLSTNLIRPGKEIDYTLGKNINEVIKKANETSKYVNYKEYDGNIPSKDFVKKIFDSVYEGFTDVRSEYVNKYQDDLYYVLGFLFGSDYSQVFGLLDYFKDNTMKNLVNILSENGLKKYIKDGFFYVNMKYDEEKIDKAISSFFDLITVSILPNLSIDNLITFIKNSDAIIPNHFCEVALAYMRA